MPQVVAWTQEMAKTGSAPLFFQLRNSLRVDVAGNTHPAEIVNKHFVPNLWIFDLS